MRGTSSDSRKFPSTLAKSLSQFLCKHELQTSFPANLGDIILAISLVVASTLSARQRRCKRAPSIGLTMTSCRTVSASYDSLRISSSPFHENTLERLGQNLPVLVAHCITPRSNSTLPSEISIETRIGSPLTQTRRLGDFLSPPISNPGNLVCSTTRT